VRLAQDRFGLSWQIIPERMGELLSDPDLGVARAMQAMLQMQKIDLKVLEGRSERVVRDPGRASSVSWRSDRGGGRWRRVSGGDALGGGRTHGAGTAGRSRW
jgi:hypothetical protein